MLNAGRVTLGIAAAVAVASAASFIAVMATPGALAVGSTNGYTANCFDSTVWRSGYAGIYLGNEGSTPITLDDVRVLEHDGITVNGVWTLHNWNDGGTQWSFGTVGHVDDTVPWADREPVRGTTIEPGENLSLVVKVTRDKTVTDAAVHDLRVDYTTPFGLATSARSHAVVGFSDPTLGDDTTCTTPG